MAASVDSTTTLRLPCAATSVSAARSGLQSWMTEQGGSGESVEDARVVISELVSNSVRHARPLSDGSILVAWAMDGHRLQLSVTDGGADTHPRNVLAGSSAMAGRGMAIVDVLTAKWWVERSPSRSTVHAQLEV